MLKSFEIIIFQHFCFILGGVESLYFRMMKWAKGQGVKSVLIIDGNSPMDSSWKNKLKEIDVSLYHIHGVYPFYRIKDEHSINLDLSGYKTVLYISDYFEGYIRGEHLKSQYNIPSFVNLFYILAPHTILKSRIPLIRYLENKILYYGLKTNSIIFMDEETRQTAVKAHDKLFDGKQKIVRLGYEVGSEVSEKFLSVKYNSLEKHICAIARFDFPFKIYILGLIDIFIALSVKYPMLKLIIIGKGPDRGTVVKKIEGLDKTIAEKITLLDGVPYEKLKTYIDSAYINVGMGTTILDFANRSVPSIVSLANETEDVSYGIWSDNWHVLGGFLHDDMAPLKAISRCIEDVLEMNQKEYISLCKLHRRLLVDHYSMEHVMGEILTHDIADVNPINPLVLHMYLFYLYLLSGIDWLFPKYLKLFARDKRS